jgi:hypothetical protein
VASVDKKRDIESVAKEISSLLTSETLSQSIKKRDTESVDKKRDIESVD